jgi:hypothetical protein
VPGAAAGLADVGAADPEPLVVGRGGEHLAEQLAVALLEVAALGQGPTGLGDAVGQLVADPLQLAEVENPGGAGGRGDRGVELDPAEGLGKQARELVLEPPDLAAQLATGKRLVGLDDPGEAASLGKFPHRSSWRV